MKRVIDTRMNFFGSHLTCTVVNHGTEESRCREFVVERSPFRYGRWLVKCFLFAGLFYLVNLHHLNFIARTSLTGLLVLVLLLRLHLAVQRESVLVISSLGIQLTTTFVSGRSVSSFIDTTAIEAVVINEGISMHCILYYLAIIFKGDTQRIQPLFHSTWPRLDFLIQVYRYINSAIVGHMSTAHKTKI